MNKLVFRKIKPVSQTANLSWEMNQEAGFQSSVAFLPLENVLFKHGFVSFNLVSDVIFSSGSRKHVFFRIYKNTT